MKFLKVFKVHFLKWAYVEQANFIFSISKSVLLEVIPGYGKTAVMSDHEYPKLGDSSSTATSTDLAQSRCSVNV